ncbi:MAG: hypothetical protein HYU36_14395 [Planctomycetes bacterium]|nr:hypothetical protein [Planctomycetota bacterium]
MKCLKVLAAFSFLLGVVLIGRGPVILSTALAQEVRPASGFNLVSNGGFELDWDNPRGEVMSCPVQARVTFGQADGVPDGWVTARVQGEDMAWSGRAVIEGCQRVSGGHSGSYAMRVLPGKALSQAGIGYGVHTSGSVPSAPLALSFWARGTADGDSLSVSLILTSSAGVEVTRAEKTFSCSPQWARHALELAQEAAGIALKSLEKPAGAISITLSLKTSEASKDVLVDDVSLERPVLPPPYSLAANPGFEETDASGWPVAWRPVRKSLRHVGSNWYYIWRSWYHYLGEPRGENHLDSLVAAAGRRSLRMNVAPGDEKYVESEPIALNQPGPQRMAIRFDYNAYLLANLLIQVLDDQGREVFFDSPSPGTTGGWHAYQAEFIPRPINPRATHGGVGEASYAGDPIALKSCSVRIGVRGVNGSNHDDINEWINVNHAGVLWIDNVAFLEVDTAADAVRARGARTFEIAAQPAGLTVENIDLGERLFGENAVSVTLVNRGQAAAAGSVQMTLLGPFREDDPRKSGYAMGAAGQDRLLPPPARQPDQSAAFAFNLGSGQRTTAVLPYTLTRLLEDWRHEYRVRVAVDGVGDTLLTFGTWSQAALVEVEKCYLSPDETQQTVSLNLGIARPRLDRTRTLRLEVRRARDDQRVLSRDVGDFQALAAGFNLSPLPQAWQGDSTNFCQFSLDVAALPIHPQTKPVRDHYILAQGIDAAGQVLFEGRSPRFGRMEVHDEKFEPIQKVEISPDNYLLVNGKPFFNRGHIRMPQHFGPSAFSRKPFVNWRQYGFNTTGVGRRYTPEDLKTAWDALGLYVITQMVEPVPPMKDETRNTVKADITHPGILGINFIEWESAPKGGSADDNVRYAREIKGLLGGRPLWISAGWYSPTVNGVVYPAYLEHDLFAPENNSYFQPSQLAQEVGAKKRARGERYVLNTYPNVFNDMPWKVQRFEHWTEIVRGHTGYTIIGIPGDSTLFRGMNGEIRFIEPILFGKEKPRDVSIEPAVEHLVRAWEGRTYILATNAGPVIGGDWQWNTEIRDQGAASHSGDALWSRFHDFLKDYHSHFYRDGQPRSVQPGDTIVQYLFIPPGVPISSLVLMVRGNGDWSHHAVWGAFDHGQFTDSGVRMWLAKDMHQMFWGTVGFCGPEGSDPHQENLVKFIFTAEQFHSLGALPPAGKWARLEVPVQTLGLGGKVIDGFGFLSRGGRAWWERTLLVQGGKETVLCDGSVGVPPDQLRRVRFNVPGLAAGSRVQVVFEEREIAAQDGFFEDDLSGEPGYQNLWVGIYGDKFGDTGYYGDGVFYNYNWGKVAARLYEVP